MVTKKNHIKQRSYYPRSTVKFTSVYRRAVESLDDVAQRVVDLARVEVAVAECAVEEEFAGVLVEHCAGPVHAPVDVVAAVSHVSAIRVVGLPLSVLGRDSDPISSS